MSQIQFAERPIRAFLCHSSGDKDRVRTLHRRLSDDGVDVWLDEEALLPGQYWELEIQKEIGRADVIIVCISSGSLTKTGYVQKEIKIALDAADKQPEGSIFIIPLRLDECRLPLRLQHLQRVDWFGEREEHGYAQLMRALEAKGHTPRSNIPFDTRPLPSPPDVKHGFARQSIEEGVGLRGLIVPRANRTSEGRFGLMFKDLPAFEPADDLLRQLAETMHESPAALADNPQIPAGFTFFGQFVDHDLTLDTTPLQLAAADPEAKTYFRSARYDLDSVYGQGPSSDPNALVPFDPADADKLLIGGSNGLDTAAEDLPRRPDTKLARIGDGRNEENLIIAQLQLAFLRFHNALVDHVRSQGTPAPQVFAEAQRLARWHYQWVVVHDFLGRVIGQGMLRQILEERPGKKSKVQIDFYKPGNPNRPMMPLEFAVAAYRFSPSMIRPGYRMNAQAGGIFFGPTPTDSNLNGFRPLPARLVIDWANFFDIAGQPPPQRARRIDAALVEPLFTRPDPVDLIPDDPTIQRDRSLAHRNLLRGKRVGLPSGQAVAQAMDVPVLSNQELGVGSEAGWDGQAPLWYYILKEAEHQHNGLQLGDVGGRIVGEVLVGLLERDRNSYLRRDPGFRPSPPIAPGPGQFTMGDLLRFAGAV